MRRQNYLAVMKLSETSGIGIVALADTSKEFIEYQRYSAEENSRVHTVLLRVDEQGFAYFISKGVRCYLKNFTRLYKPAPGNPGLDAHKFTSQLMQNK